MKTKLSKKEITALKKDIDQFIDRCKKEGTQCSKETKSVQLMLDILNEEEFTLTIETIINEDN